MSKVLLLASSPSENNNIWLPYALLFLRSALEKRGHDVALVDFQTGAKAYSTFETELLKKPDVLGVSLFCGPGVSLAKKASRLCREISPGTCIVWGGILPTISPEMILEEEIVDYVIRYEAEESFAAFVDQLAKGEVKGKVPNLAYKTKTKMVIPGPPTDFTELSGFPLITFDGVSSSKYIHKRLHFGKRVLPILTSRGCPYSCSFCYNLYYNQRRWRPFPVEWTLDTIEKLVKTFRIDGLLAFDDNFFVDQERAREIFEGTRARGHEINWFVELRIDQIIRMSVDELKEFEKLGLRLVYIGVESGSDRILKLFNKGITSEDVRLANRKLIQTNISPCYTFIVGAPTETSEETLETIDLATELLSENPLAAVWQFNQYTPYPGTPLYKTAIENGFRPYNNLNDWDVGWTWRDQNISSTTFSKSEMATLRYAGLFQKPDLYISNRTYPYRLAYRALRTAFRTRMRHHIFTPFVDTWTVGAVYKMTRILNRFQLDAIRKEL